MKLRLAALTSVLALIALACGQKPGVHARGVGLLPGQLTGGTGAGAGGPLPSPTPSFDPTTGQFIDPATGQALDPTTGQPPTGTTSTTTSTGSSGGSGGGGGGGGGDRTGVTNSTITIGLHAPVTGAAPVRQNSFDSGKDIYWRKGANGKEVKIHGRSVKVVFANDEYNPSKARGVCQQMAQQQNAFLLIGGAGTDQIKSCADYSKSNGIPYLSAGVVQNALRNHGNYFALSMSYAQQGPILAQYVQKRLSCSPNCRVLVIATDTANFDDAVTSFKKHYPSAQVKRPSKRASGSEYGDDACPVTSPFEVVYPLTSPTFFLELEAAASCNPRYVGVGISMGLDTVAANGCRTPSGSMDGSIFFSPAPAFESDGKRDAAFTRAGGTDDIQYLLWGLSKAIHQMLLKTGPNLTRQNFMKTVQSSSFSSGTFPPLKYSRSNHFGGQSVHVLRAVCAGGGGHYVTAQKFAKGF
ncbi:MAG TPA: ABC transporter substrate-binding protein [Actinomycetota bacterium]|nr:ABC transporter substrate-binding protein [Actinomycetota bacterium]